MEEIDFVPALLVLVVSLVGWVYAEHRATRRVTRERDKLQADLDAMQVRLDAVALDRNVWRDIARDSLRVIEVVRGVNQRAARVVEAVVAKTK